MASLRYHIPLAGPLPEHMHERMQEQKEEKKKQVGRWKDMETVYLEGVIIRNVLKEVSVSSFVGSPTRRFIESSHPTETYKYC